MVELSDCDSEKWATIRDYRVSGKSRPSRRIEDTSAGDDYEAVGEICQVQRRLTSEEVATVVARFRDDGESMAALAREYGCNRKTISNHLKKAGLAARETACRDELVERMVKLYHDGLSLERVGRKLSVSGSTVRNYLLGRGMPLRNCQGH